MNCSNSHWNWHSVCVVLYFDRKKKLTIIFKGHFGGWCPNLPIFWVKEKFLKHEYTWLLSNDNSLILSRKSGKCTEKIFRKIFRFWPGFGQSDIILLDNHVLLPSCHKSAKSTKLNSKKWRKFYWWAHIRAFAQILDQRRIFLRNKYEDILITHALLSSCKKIGKSKKGSQGKVFFLENQVAL